MLFNQSNLKIFLLILIILLIQGLFLILRNGYFFARNPFFKSSYEEKYDEEEKKAGMLLANYIFKTIPLLIGIVMLFIDNGTINKIGIAILIISLAFIQKGD